MLEVKENLANDHLEGKDEHLLVNVGHLEREFILLLLEDAHEEVKDLPDPD